jgi:Leucine Rich repeat
MDENSFLAKRIEFIVKRYLFQNFPHGAKHVHSLILRCCNISDRGLEALMEFLQSLYKLEIAGCNEITEQVCKMTAF